MHAEKHVLEEQLGLWPRVFLARQLLLLLLLQLLL